MTKIFRAVTEGWSVKMNAMAILQLDQTSYIKQKDVPDADNRGM